MIYIRILLNTDSSDWLVVASSNQDCESSSSTPVLFGEDVDTSCDLKCVTMTAKQFVNRFVKTVPNHTRTEIQFIV